MDTVTSTASAVWEGNVARGSGEVSGERGIFSGLPFDLPTRIGETSGDKTTPEELLAAAHVACLTMSIGTALAKRRTPAERLEASSHVTLDMTGERPQINHIAVQVRGTVPGIDDATFREVAQEAAGGCLITRVVTNGGAKVEIDGTLA